ncbi:cation diffusion facilitator family transporter [Methanobrevibacter millerae]|uniref:Transporter CDF family n=1 Tax=Methanobrevibacter millerae TaxID=230361 RepID=A0A0U2TTI1_9EURY|nr:cation diffusion facilitator family transporter [Methanobrevibacter millerae]ALT69171.1 transporter CDF family [Methanobrevibacter millerae]
MRIDTHHHHKKASDNLAFVFLLNLTFNIIVIIGGLATNSMAILADCIHDMSDTFSMAIAWILEHVAQKGATDKFSYGYQRFSILGAVITSTFVIVMAFFILSEAIPRLFSPEGVDAEGMLIIGIIGLVFKTISVWRLHGGETFNEKAIFYHLLGDIFEWVAILILSVILIFWQDISYLDPFVSIAIAVWLIFNLGRTLYKSLEVLLQKTPDNFDVEEFKQQILEIDGVNALDDFHIWSLDGIDSVMTVKVDVDFGKNVENIKKEIYDISNKYHVVDITIELD